MPGYYNEMLAGIHSDKGEPVNIDSGVNRDGVGLQVRNDAKALLDVGYEDVTGIDTDEEQLGG